MAKVRQRARYSTEFKKSVVRFSLSLPPNARVKPTCRAFDFAIEPVQIRKWIRALQPLIELEGKSEGESQTTTRHATPTPPSEASGLSESEEMLVGKRGSDQHLSHLSRLPDRAGEGAGAGAPVFRDWPASWQAPIAAPPYAFAAHVRLYPMQISPQTSLPPSKSIQYPPRPSAPHPAAPAVAPAVASAAAPGLTSASTTGLASPPYPGASHAETTAAAQELILLCQSVGGGQSSQGQ